MFLALLISSMYKLLYKYYKLLSFLFFQVQQLNEYEII